MPQTLINPSTEETLPHFAEHTPEQVEQRLAQAASAFPNWRQASISDRAGCFLSLAKQLRRHQSELCACMAREMGKPVTAGESEIEKCAAACEFFAQHANVWLQPNPLPSDASKSYVRHDPLGVILAIMPWNFPFWQFFRFAAPALMAGNTAVLKHAPNVPACAESIAQLFLDAGFPVGAVVNVRVSNARAEELVRHSAIAAITLTGSERAGKAVAIAAASVLKKSVLELGGSDPFIVLPDAEIESTARAAAQARCVNSGQSCIAAKRFIVVGDAENFARTMAAAMGQLKMGYPADRQTDLGPLARLDLLEHLHNQVQRSLAAGAKLLVGGQRLPQKGYYYEPTILTHVRPGMPAFDEETFGPVAAIISARDIDDAIRLANLSRYGLGASLWTRDPIAAEALVPRLEAGSVFINGIVKSDPRLPFGGIKNSGWGRELSQVGMLEFTNAKTVWLK